MSIYRPTPGTRAPAVMIPLSQLSATTVGQAPPTFLPNTPQLLYLAGGPGTGLTVTWTAPAVDSAHSAAIGFNQRFSPSGAASWTTVSDVASPYLLSDLTDGAVIDVQVQSVNAVGTSPWSATT